MGRALWRLEVDAVLQLGLRAKTPDEIGWKNDPGKRFFLSFTLLLVNMCEVK